MTDGHRPPMHIVQGSTDPRCQGLCKGDRPAYDSPARFGRLPDGTKVLWCPCCHGQLRAQGPLDVVGRPPNLAFDLDARHRRFIDDSCGYDVVVLKDVAAT